MIALKITDIKNFMNQFLGSDTFDSFLLLEAVIRKDATFTIDGHLNTDYYSSTELEENGLAGCEILSFRTLRPVCYQLIRGSHTPASFRFVLALSPEQTASTLQQSASGLGSRDVAGILFNLNFHEGTLTLTTGISYRTFTMDHTLDHEWDSLLQKFLNRHRICYEEV